jgi:mRNA interferase MazF
MGSGRLAMVEVARLDILLISLDPLQGAEIKKTRPCVVVSPDEMNKYIKTIIIAPMTSSIKNYPTRIPIYFEEKVKNIVLDQIRMIDKLRIVKKLGVLDFDIILNKMFSK